MRKKGNDNIIYKFASINEYSLKNLILGKLRFNPPTLMNDQLEGLIKIKNPGFKPTNSAINNFIKENNLHSQTARKFIKSNGFVNFYMRYWFNVELKKFGISCFTESPTESLMWAHYADKHSGICIIYDKDKLIDNLKELSSQFEFVKVRYDCQPVIMLKEKDSKIIYESNLPIISTKHANWQYENEIRIVFKGDEEYTSDSYFVGNSPVKGIIYGYRISFEDKDALSTILRNDPQYSNVKEYKEIIDYTTGHIRIEPD